MAGSRRSAVVATASVTTLILVWVVGLHASAALRADLQPGPRPADVEFSLKPGADREDRRAIAVELWRSGVVGSVVAPEGDALLYKVFVKQQGNWLQVQDVSLRLKQMPQVLSTHSAVARLLGE